MNLRELVRDIPDFPKKGIMFRDISPLLQNPEALHFIAQALVKNTNLDLIDHFVGIESRGFILAALLAGVHRKGFIPLRKAGKLPPPVLKETYKLEYGEAEVELAPGTGRVMILDDVLATGGTLRAAIKICKDAGYHVEDVAVLIDLPFLNDLRFGENKIHSLIQY